MTSFTNLHIVLFREIASANDGHTKLSVAPQLIGNIDAAPKGKTATLSYDQIIQETTQLLYKDSSKLNYWLTQPPPKVYIYNTLPDDMSVTSVSKCIDKRFSLGATCGWFPKVCNENSTSSNPHYNVYRDNFNSDVFLMRRFQTYPHTTTDPSQADFFLVPYPHRSHCYCANDNAQKIYSCSYSFKYIQQHVFNNLSFYNATTKDRHLFLLGSDFALSNPPFRREVTFHLSTGPANGCRPNRHNAGKPWTAVCGSMTVPYVNTHAEYQPGEIQQRSRDWWLTRPRKFGLAAFMGTPPQLGVRREFMQRKQDLLGDSIVGLPVAIIDIGERKRFLTNHGQVLQTYQDSVFCPTLAGDDCGQKRFFDVIMSGCIPVVLSYPTSDEAPTWPSWFKPGQCSLRRSYPYSRGTFHADIQAGIDFTDFVVQVNGTCGLDCLRSTLEGISPDEVKQKREGLRRYAHLFSYGIGETTANVDTFSTLMVSIRHYLASLQNRR
jgi:hypothetical protein